MQLRSTLVVRSKIRTSSSLGKMTPRWTPLLVWIFVTVVTAVQMEAAPTLTLAWDRNLDSNIGGYRLYIGTTSTVYTQVIDIGNATTTVISNLVAGKTYFFAVTDYNKGGQESGYSNEVSYAVQNVAAPQASPLPDTYHVGVGGSLRVGLCTLTPHGLMRFTTDGSTPTAGPSGSGSLIGNVGVAILPPGARVVKAIAYDPTSDLARSPVVTFNYTVVADADPAKTSADPVVQPAAGSYNVRKRTQDGQFWYNVCSKNPAALFRATIDGSDPSFSPPNGVLFTDSGVGENYLNFYLNSTQNYRLKVRAQVPGLPESKVVTVNISLVDN
jgi:hypothetical protein